MGPHTKQPVQSCERSEAKRLEMVGEICNNVLTYVLGDLGGLSIFEEIGGARKKALVT